MRLIDLEALKKKMCELCNQDYSDEPCEPSDCVFYNAIENIPSIDPVHAAGACYCCECQEFDADGGFGYCNHWQRWVASGDFCSKGKRTDKKRT
jgi:hypothetical protein